MPTIDPEKARQFACAVVRKLHAAGHRALWAGGCVRDRLLDQAPVDYDVATDATPDEIRRVFGARRTLAVGAAFGVIVVLGPRGAGRVEVATFRKDAEYGDGRHPDRVTFSSAEEDARRRDFTINGLFFDPLTEQVIDYVDGRRDLRRGVIRAIGDPDARIAEDKLRMLRAVRFAAAFDFRLDEATLEAIRRRPAEITAVSAERIAAEMRRMLVHRRRAEAVRLLHRSGLLQVVLPEAMTLDPTADDEPHRGESIDTPWRRTLAVLAALRKPGFPTALAALVREIECGPVPLKEAVRSICRRWRLSGDETARTVYLVAHEAELRRASRLPWPQLQRLLVTDGIDELAVLADAVARVVDGSTDEVDYCRRKLSLPKDQLDPEPLITGDDLIALGIPAGSVYRMLLGAVRDAQLENRIADRQAALELAERLWRSHGKG